MSPEAPPSGLEVTKPANGKASYRYFVWCVVAVGLVMVLAWVWRRFVPPFLEARAAVARCNVAGKSAGGFHLQCPKDIELLGGPDKAYRKLRGLYLAAPRFLAPYRATCVRMLGYCGERAVPELIGWLDDIDADVREAAAMALNQARAPQAVDKLITKLKDSSEKVRSQSAKALGKIGDRRCIPALILTLGDHDGQVQGNAARALVEMPDVGAIGPLIKLLRKKGGGDYERGEAAVALGAIGTGQSIEALVAALKDESRWVRAASAAALELIHDVRTLSPLLDALMDPSSGVREHAARALGSIGDRRAVEPLLDALNDEDLYVREKAAWALGRIGDRRAVEPLQALLHDKHSEVVMAAQDALDRITQNPPGDNSQKPP